MAQYSFDQAPGFEHFTFKNTPQDAVARIARGETCAFLSDPVLSGEKQFAKDVIEQCKILGADYADLRLGTERFRWIVVNDTNLSMNREDNSTGIGIRVLYKGFWGFAATPDLTGPGVKKAVERAVSMAKGVAAITPADLGLQMKHFAHEPVVEAQYDTPVGLCAMTAGVDELSLPFREAAEIALSVDGVKRSNGFAAIFGRRRVFASTEGSYIVTTHSMLDSQLSFHAVKDGNSAYRTIVGPNMAGGYEHLLETDYRNKAKAFAEEAVLKCTADKPESGKYTLILDGHNLALTMHESVGHPTELDRVLGYELGFAGGSFADLGKQNNFQYGSNIVNFTANNRIQYGAATQGYDDEGVECQSFPVIRDGILVGYGTNRETAHHAGYERSNGTCRSTSWKDTPIVRIPNLYLEPGKQKLSLEDLIADTKDGIYMMGRDSFSIDQMRYNFQFGANMCYRIRNGKVEEPLRDVIYQSLSPDFWNSCDAICDASEWQMHGVFNCGKGQPIQLGKMTHGAAPSRFRDIRVGF